MKDKKTFEHRIGDRVYHFMVDNDSPIGEVKDALCKFMAHIVNFEHSVLAQMAAQEESKPLEEKKDVAESQSS